MASTKRKTRVKPYARTVERITPAPRGRVKPRKVVATSAFAMRMLDRINALRRDLDKPGYRRVTPIDLIERRQSVLNDFTRTLRRGCNSPRALRTFVLGFDNAANSARDKASATYGRAHLHGSAAARESLPHTQYQALTLGMRAQAAREIYKEIMGEPLPVREPRAPGQQSARAAARMFGLV